MTKQYHDSNKRPHRLTNREKIGDRIRELRIEKGLSMRAVEALGGPSITTQCLVENGLINVQVCTMKAFADVLDVQVSEFFLYNGSEIEDIAGMVYKLPKKRVTALLKRLMRKVMN